MGNNVDLIPELDELPKDVALALVRQVQDMISAQWQEGFEDGAATCIACLRRAIIGRDGRGTEE